MGMILFISGIILGFIISNYLVRYRQIRTIKKSREAMDRVINDLGDIQKAIKETSK
jgi:hypothetical protein